MNATYNRRGFLLTSTQAAAGAALARWNPGAQAALDPPDGGSGQAFVIDTHTHFYDPSRPQGVPWPPRDDALLYRTVLPKDYRAQPVPRPVTGTVVVEASSWLEDNQWVLDLAASEPFITGLVGNLPAGTKPFAEQLKRFAANPLFRGIRLGARSLQNRPDDDPLIDDLKRLADRDLALDLLGGRDILPFAERLAKAVPHLRIVIDHLAGLAIDGKAPPAAWVESMRTLGRLPGIYCKLSGLVEGTGRSDGTAPREVAFYRPVLDEMLEIFGPGRLIYASNWPVSERFASLDTVQRIVSDYFRPQGQTAVEAVFWRSAKAAYRWVARTPSGR